MGSRVHKSAYRAMEWAPKMGLGDFGTRVRFSIYGVWSRTMSLMEMEAEGVGAKAAANAITKRVLHKGEWVRDESLLTAEDIGKILMACGREPEFFAADFSGDSGVWLDDYVEWANSVCAVVKQLYADKALERSEEFFFWYESHGVD